LQLKIAKILGSLDDKIELNRQTNQSLEQISQAILKSWFVDFEPVKAKDHIRKLGGNSKQIEKAAQAIISGAVNLEDILKGSDLTDINAKIESKLDAKMALQKNEQQNELAETARLFPDSLVESELGLMPNGWGTQKLEQGFNITMGQSPPGHTYNENKIGMAFFQGRRDFGWRYPKNRVYCTEPKRKAKAGDTLLSVRAPVGDINFATIDCCIGRGLAAIRHKSGCEIYTYYSMTELRHQLQFCYSDGTVFNSINQKDLRSIRLIRTPSSIVSRFGKILKASESQIRNNKDQSVFLTELRDALLPKLLAGELKVNV
jgi:type I restriction enzyme S subunit